MATALRWRIVCTAPQSGLFWAQSEIQLRQTPGGADLIGPAGSNIASLTVSGSFNAGTNPPAYLIDDNTATWWACNSGGFPAWVEIQFLTPQEVGELYLRARSDSSGPAQSPRDFRVEYHDGTQWQVVRELANEPSWATGEARTYGLDSSLPYLRRASTVAGYAIDTTRGWRISTVAAYSIHGPNTREISSVVGYAIERAAAPPGPVQNLVATTPAHTSSTVTWEAPVGLNPEIETRYEGEYWNGSAWVSLFPEQVFATLQYVWNTTSRPNGTYYKVRVRGVNQYGEGDWVESNLVTILHPPTAPTISATRDVLDIAVSLVSSSVGAETAELWGANSSADLPFDGPGAGATLLATGWLATPQTFEESFTGFGQTRYYRLYVTNSAGSSRSGVASVATPAFAITATAMSQDTITVGLPVLPGVATNYRLYSSRTDSSVPTTEANLLAALGDTPPEGFLHEELPSSTRVYYRLTAVETSTGNLLVSAVATDITFAPYVPPPELPPQEERPFLRLWPDEDCMWIDVKGIEGASTIRVFYAPASAGMTTENFATVGTEFVPTVEREYIGNGQWGDTPFDGTINADEVEWLRQTGLTEGVRYRWIAVAYDGSGGVLETSPVTEAVYGWYITPTELAGPPYTPNSGQGEIIGNSTPRVYWEHIKLLMGLQPIHSVVGRLPPTHYYGNVGFTTGGDGSYLAAARTEGDDGFVAVRMTLDPNVTGYALFYPQYGQELSAFGVFGSAIEHPAGPRNGLYGIFAYIFTGFFTPTLSPGNSTLNLLIYPQGGQSYSRSINLGFPALVPWWHYGGNYGGGEGFFYPGKTAVLELEYLQDLVADPDGGIYNVKVWVNSILLIDETFDLGVPLPMGRKGIHKQAWGGAADFSGFQAMTTEPPCIEPVQPCEEAPENIWAVCEVAPDNTLQQCEVAPENTVSGDTAPGGSFSGGPTAPSNAFVEVERPTTEPC